MHSVHVQVCLHMCVRLPCELWWDAPDAVITQCQVAEHRQVGQLHWD